MHHCMEDKGEHLSVQKEEKRLLAKRNKTIGI
jgi:hypothetical protein